MVGLIMLYKCVTLKLNNSSALRCSIFNSMLWSKILDMPLARGVGEISYMLVGE